MKPSHFTTPRTLADCYFSGGYSVSKIPSGDQFAGVVLAIVIGICIGALLVHWLAL